MRTMGTTSQTAIAISHQSQHASKLARNTMDAPTGHGRRGRRWGRATSRRAGPAESRHQSTFPAPRIAICLRKKVSLSGGNSHQPPRYTCCNQIISQSHGHCRFLGLHKMPVWPLHIGKISTKWALFWYF